MSEREISVSQAVHETQRFILSTHQETLILGLNAASPTGMFETMTGLHDEFGSDRVIETPASEAACMGIALGMASSGMRPIVIHQRLDFAILAVDQLVNQVAKWHFMYGGKLRAPLVVRMIVGRGWGQGPQHSQALHAWFAHVPGLRVVMSSFPQETRNNLYWSVLDDAPVVFIEHRWMHLVKGNVSSGPPTPEISSSIIRRVGSDVTLVSTSFMTVECLVAAKLLAGRGIEAEVVEIITVSPLDVGKVRDSVSKTGRLLVADIGVAQFGVSSEVIFAVLEDGGVRLRAAPVRIGLPSVPTPTGPRASAAFYPTSITVANSVLEMIGASESSKFDEKRTDLELDVPNTRFLGPY
jgi:pyruvate dehydrogenase E1 component beta subunit